MNKITVELTSHEVSILLRALVWVQEATRAKLRRASDKIPGRRAGLAMEMGDYKEIATKLANAELVAAEVRHDKG